MRYDMENAPDKFIKNAENYLIVVQHCRWNGAAGYRLINDKNEILSRSYDVTQAFPQSFHKKKVMAWDESSHDVPTGSAAVAIALTKRETNYLETLFWKGDFAKVDDFVAQYVVW